MYPHNDYLKPTTLDIRKPQLHIQKVPTTKPNHQPVKVSRRNQLLTPQKHREGIHIKRARRSNTVMNTTGEPDKKHMIISVGSVLDERAVFLHVLAT